MVFRQKTQRSNSGLPWSKKQWQRPYGVTSETPAAAATRTPLLRSLPSLICSTRSPERPCSPPPDARSLPRRFPCRDSTPPESPSPATAPARHPCPSSRRCPGPKTSDQALQPKVLLPCRVLLPPCQTFARAPTATP
ncbi:hypothetical protein EUGRSUZ_I01012 [Eucalyptus grandis]|uniref:Uncharacterized protein n=2 Tax=Eucalyptus grandis TaxID=71139 RepID=A0ACC3JDX4_EUCGR|nr:hypothetical protein EUGRSUZ_I01012 [Eucalyptus grandis]